MTKRIVSVQDISCLGQCSMTVALPVLSAMGVETAILPSAILSTHTGGFQDCFVHDLTEQMPEIISHWQREGIRFDAVYTGYISDARQFGIIASLRALLREDGLVIVDPAMADHGRLYKGLGPDIVEGMRQLVSQADVILPNLTEAAILLGREYREQYTREELEQMLWALGALGPRYTIVTGVGFEHGKIGAVCYDRQTERVVSYFTDRAEKSYHGTGDIFSSVAVADIVRGRSMEQALKDACEFTARAITATVGDDSHPYGVHFESVLAEMLEK